MTRLNTSDVMFGAAVIFLLLAIYGNSLWQLWQYHGDIAWFDLINDTYFQHVLKFSLYQAFISAILSVGLGLLTAHAFFYQNFAAKKWVLRLFSLTMVLPVLVVIFGIMGVYGKSGWLGYCLHWLGFEDGLRLYGITGILLAHVFFNIPLATKVFLQSLQSIPHQQRQLASQLGIRNSYFVRLIEWPYVRQHIMPVFLMIFMLCFTSFTIVLTLGGGPKYTTLEVAIFQAVTFDFELGKAAMLAFVQLLICFALFYIGSYFSKYTPTAVSKRNNWIVPLSPLFNLWHKVLLFLMIGFVLLPLLNVVVGGLSLSAWQTSLKNPELWRAIGFSLVIAITSGFFAVLMTMGLLLAARQFHWHGQQRIARHIVNVGMMILAVPTLVLAVGLYLLLQQYTIGALPLFCIVVLCNGLMAMPFTLRLLQSPLHNNMTYYEKLSESLGVRGWQRWRLIEWQAIRQPVKTTFALAAALSLGDFTAIALFGNQSFTSLPRLLYQQLGHYRSQEAAVTALILLLFCAAIFLIIERYDDSSKTDTV